MKNQRNILNGFHFNHAEEFESYTEYVDDGHTGTDTECESFQRLLGAVMSGKINCVVVKDLFRFVRNYSDAGSLIDNLFISLAEGVDSDLNPDSVNSIIVPITNVMNAQYCYQTSKKIRQVFGYKRCNGQYIGSFAPYGYIKDPKDKHQLIVDADAAEIVKRVYSMLLQGSSKRALALYLNEHGIPAPWLTAVKRACPFIRLWRMIPRGGTRL
ncbi:recombinase family protein [Oscillospiraceae bacterium 38-13]